MRPPRAGLGLAVSRWPMEEQSQPRGLVAVYEVASSGDKPGSLPAIPPRFWLWTATVLVAWGIFYWKKTQGEIESQKATLFARQRGVAAELGPRFEPLRKRIEDWTVEAARPPIPGDLVAPELEDLGLRGAAGHLPAAADGRRGVGAKSLRKAASASLRDGFTACLFHEPNADPTSGPPCKASHDCAAGSFCNEVDHCMPPAQPYNMRAAYRGTRILSDEWTVSLRTASDDMRCVCWSASSTAR